MADASAALEEGLRQGLAEMLRTRPTAGILEQRSPEELVEAGRRAAHLALAPFLWESRLGAMLETGEVCERLGVTRQAVAKAVDAGRLIALPAGKTRRFPVWQFSFYDQTTIRPEVAEIVAAFRETFPEVRPLQIASWAMTGQPELKDELPSIWLERGEKMEPLLDAARRGGWALAQ